VNLSRLSDREALDLMCPLRPRPKLGTFPPAQTNTFCPTGFWGCPDLAERFWQSCLQMVGSPSAAPCEGRPRLSCGAVERLVAAGRLLQFQDLPEGALGWSWFAWLNGATAALSRMPLTELLARTEPYYDYDLAARFSAVMGRPGLVSYRESPSNVRVLNRLRRALQEVTPSEFTSLEQFVATMALAGWMGIDADHLPTVIMLETWRQQHPIAIAHFRLLVNDTALSEQERSHPLARFWGAYYRGDPHHTHILRIAMLSLAKAKQHAWSVKEFVLDGFSQALELTEQDLDLANALIGNFGPDDRDVRWFERHACRNITQIDPGSVWLALPGAIQGEYAIHAQRLLPIHAVDLLRGAYTFSFFWGLLSERVKGEPTSLTKG